MIRRGEPWGSPVAGPPDGDVAGDDPALAELIDRLLRSGVPVPRLRFSPSTASDLARAVGLTGSGAGSVEVPLDVVSLTVEARGTAPSAPLPGERPEHAVIVVNAVVLGAAPDRLRWWHRRRTVQVVVDGRIAFEGPATTVIVANGQFLRGHDLVPAGHPGDGRVEVQVYALEPGERSAMRRRLPSASHLPHPRIRTSAGAQIGVEWSRPVALEVDGQVRGRSNRLRMEVRPGACRLML